MGSIEKQRAKAFWLEHIQQWDQSALSQAAYCRQHGLCKKRFSYRKQQSAFAKKAAISATGFTRVQVDNSIPSPASDVGLSIRFNNDMRIEGITENNLALILPLLTILR